MVEKKGKRGKRAKKGGQASGRPVPSPVSDTLAAADALFAQLGGAKQQVNNRKGKDKRKGHRKGGVKQQMVMKKGKRAKNGGIKQHVKNGEGKGKGTGKGNAKGDRRSAPPWGNNPKPDWGNNRNCVPMPAWIRLSRPVNS